MSETVECPTCGRSGFDKWFGFVSHHVREHPDGFEDRFWARVDVGKEDECWEWQSSINTPGYGHFRDDGELYLAHRTAWKLEEGDIGDNWVLHHCDNKICVNTNHLYLGDESDNVQDAWDRGQMYYTGPYIEPEDFQGEKGPGAKLTNSEVKKIKEKLGDYTQVELADEYGVQQGTISNIKLGKTWSHID